ncbi:hypothetical protein SEA_SPECKS_210 [Mycobacterium phage Specks]|nr:hypothetical protein SEA_SPECKS_210 [Mycobacterium phage Specks]
MGNNRPTTRTLPTGEKVTHHPDGRLVLKPKNSLADALSGQLDAQQEASQALTEALVQTAVTKREAQADGNPVPEDKRVF